MANEPENRDKLLALTAEIVAAHVGHNNVASNEIPALIQSIYKSLTDLGSGANTTSGKPVPAVPVKQSVRPDFLVCLEDGKKLKMLKRYLATTYKMTPEQYRERWNLPTDYPMVAPNYARTRSKLAKDIGLGSKTKKKSTAKSS